MIELIKKNKLFYLLTLLFWLACSLVLLLTAKGEPLRWINTYHQTFLDYFFVGMTYLGDGLFSVVFLLSIFLLVNMRKGLVITFVFLAVVTVVQFLKHVLFDGDPRPFTFFYDAAGLYYIPWLEIHKFNSFPSGHTAQAFCFALCLCFYTKEKKYIPLLFLFALLTGFSRMYLMQHFPLDVFAGSLIAVVVTTFLFPLIAYKITILQRPELDQPLISFLKK